MENHHSCWETELSARLCTMWFIFLCVLFGVASAQSPLVTTTEGVVQGTVATDGKYYVYYGIPYAGPTSGTNRFKPPMPPAKYTEVFQAVKPSIVCAHPTEDGIVGVEDCLVLNIYTKDLTTPKPVMVVLLGEEYSSIQNKPYRYRNLVESDILVVTLNYRLSVFGFLCLDVPDAQGNAGLKDVVQGLQWIKNNIAGFGGDPDNVVLFGHGSGAAMVDLTTMSPTAQDLVHKAIVQSGSVLAPWAVAYEPLKYAQEFAKKLGYTGYTQQELADKLQVTDLSSLSKALTSFDLRNNTVLFAPCLESASLNDTFITQTPLEILRSGNYSHIPYLTGFTDREGTIRAGQAVDGWWLQLMQANFTNFVPAGLWFESIDNKTAVADDVKRHYFSGSAVNMNTITNYLHYHGDVSILVPVIRGARERAATSREAVNLLEFSYKGTLNSDWIYPIPNDGARHGVLLNYLFDYDLAPLDHSIRDLLLGRYVWFAKTGNCTPADRLAWDPVGDRLDYLEISGAPNTEFPSSVVYESRRTNPRPADMTLWNDLYDRYGDPIETSSGHRVLCAVLVLTLCQFAFQLF